MLDAARGIVLAQGTAAATIDAIALASGAPVGSVYHRFASREALLAAVWMRAARRAQTGMLEAAASQGPGTAAERIVAAALATFDFAIGHAADAHLLVAVRREDLLGARVPASLAAQMEKVNAPVLRALRGLARDLHGRRADAAHMRLVALAVVDLPHAAVRRALAAGHSPARGLRAPLERAVRAVLTTPQEEI